MNEVELREKGMAKNAEGLAMYQEIHAGKRGIEDRAQADGLIKEAGEIMEQVESLKRAAVQDAYFNAGLGSITAGLPATSEAAPAAKVQWDSPLEWLCATIAYGVPKHKTALLKQGIIKEDFEQKLLTEGVGADGGFLVPVQYRAELFAKPGENVIVRPRAVVIPMAVPQTQMPSLDQTIIPNNQLSAYFAGILFEWIEEASQKPEVEIHFKLIDLIVHELAGWLPVSNNLIADSAISMTALISGLFGRAMADAEDWWFLNGNGAGQPMGVIHAPCTIQPNRAAPNCIDFPDITAMVHAFEPNPRGVWVAHICTMEQIMTLQDAIGNYMWIPNMVDGMPSRLMGYPIIFTEKVPNL